MAWLYGVNVQRVKCKECGELFVQQHGNQKLCGKECRLQRRVASVRKYRCRKKSDPVYRQKCRVYERERWAAKKKWRERLLQNDKVLDAMRRGIMDELRKYDG